MDKIESVAEEVAAYLRRVQGEGDDALRRVKEQAGKQGIPSITPEAGRALMVVAQAIRAGRALELGTGTGYSGIWIARGLGEGGSLVTVEGDPVRAEFARQHFALAGVGDQVRVEVSTCLDYIRRLESDSLDLVFLDATKSEYPEYLALARRALRARGVLAADNVFWQGRVFPFDPRSREVDRVTDEDLRGILEFTRRITQPEWETMILPFGDGLSISVKK